MVLYSHCLNCMKLLKSVILILIAVCVFTGCASIASLSGGPKDVTPPKLDSLKSTPNFQTRYRPEKAILYFDEWINLRNPNQILVSPPLLKNPHIRQRGKHISIEFDKTDTLRENTTYNLNFGNSIVDFTEGNPVSNFSFIFSTGDMIDSLEFRGRVKNAYDDKPEKDMLVMLYDQEEDSVVIKSKPYYFAYTNESGDFRITHIKEGYFKVFALKDANANYLYDNVSEKIGFIDTMIFITYDTLKKNILINVFQPDIPLQIKDKGITDYGKISLVFSRKPDSLRVIDSSVKILEKEILKDSTFLWFDASEPHDSIQLTLKSEDRIDTLNIKSRKKYDKPFNLVCKTTKGKANIHPDKPVILLFNQPVFINDTSGLAITDTAMIRQFFSIAIDSSNNRQILIEGKWNEENEFELLAMPGVFKGLHDQVNDSIPLKFKSLKRNNFGNLICQFDSLNSDIQYLIYLKQKEKTIEEHIIRDKEKVELKFVGLVPGNYFIEVVVDENKNGRWNGGNYLKKLHSEKTLKFQLNELKKNWDQLEKFNLKQE